MPTTLHSSVIGFDFITVSNKLSQSDKLEAVGGIAYLRNAATNVPTTRHVTYYSQIIKEKAVLRTLIKSANDISDMALVRTIKSKNSRPSRTAYF